jgi:hypothetical protein
MKEENNKKIFPITYSRERFYFLDKLQSTFEGFMKTRLFRKQRTVSEIQEFVAVLASARTALWRDINRTYLETVGADASVNAHYITTDLIL